MDIFFDLRSNIPHIAIQSNLSIKTSIIEIPVTNKVPILEYHDLSQTIIPLKNFHSPYVLHIAKFQEHMKWLYQNDYSTLLIDDLFTDNMLEKSVVLTFDDGHISNYQLAFAVLKEFNFIATFFMVPMFIGKKDYLAKEQILEMHEHGMKFGSHSLTHPYILSLSREEMIREVRKSKAKIQSILNNEIKHFSVPYGFYNKYLIQCLKQAGYKTLVTENFGYYKYRDNPFHVLPRFTVKSHFDLKSFQNIVKGRRISLLSDYARELGTQYSKAVLGYRNYIRLKSLILNKKPQPFGDRPNYH